MWSAFLITHYTGGMCSPHDTTGFVNFNHLAKVVFIMLPTENYPLSYFYSVLFRSKSLSTAQCQVWSKH
jgi:hypothetical protein